MVVDRFSWYLAYRCIPAFRSYRPSLVTECVILSMLSLLVKLFLSCTRAYDRILLAWQANICNFVTLRFWYFLTKLFQLKMLSGCVTSGSRHRTPWFLTLTSQCSASYVTVNVTLLAFAVDRRAAAAPAAAGVDEPGPQQQPDARCCSGR